MSELKLLAIETSSRTGSVALAVGDAVSESEIATPREQTALVIGLIDELLTGAGLTLGALDALVLGRGPGSFTGLRIAAGVIQGLALASGLPIVSVSSLAALAQRGFDIHAGADQALCLVDARMGEIYCGWFRRDQGRAESAADERLLEPGAVDVPAGEFIVLGDALAAYAEPLAGIAGAATGAASGLVPRARDLLPQARAEVLAGRFLPLEQALPVYLREADAWRKA